MCELLGMCANVPTDICFSFSGLMQRGGNTGPHKDGWGIVFYSGAGCQFFHDPNPSYQSEVAKLIQHYPIKSHIVISHIRKANRGRICLQNTHPFVRELWGSYWTFAHNGQIKGIKKEKLTYYLPVGTTDSEHAFCWLLDKLRQRFNSKPKRLEALWITIRELLVDLSQRGVFNVLFSDSKYLYANCSTQLYCITRKSPFGKAKLIDNDLIIDFGQETTQNDVVTVIATNPLTANEPWHEIKTGTTLVLKDGINVKQYNNEQHSELLPVN